MNKRKVLIFISWLLVFTVMITIFVLSNQTASSSTETSNGVIQEILKIFHINLSPNVVRTFAHGFEYFILCFLLNLSLFFTYEKFKPYTAFLISFIYAVSDEIHQLFVEGRACQFKDVVVDSIGAVTAVLICLIIYKIYLRGKKDVNSKTV